MHLPGSRSHERKERDEDSESDKKSQESDQRSVPNTGQGSGKITAVAGRDDGRSLNGGNGQPQDNGEGDRYTHGEARSTNCNSKPGEVLTIWPEGRDLVVERAQGDGPCEDVEVEVLRGAAVHDPESVGSGKEYSSSTSPTGRLREHAYAQKCALQERIENVKADLVKRL